jgi:hypothetical protein
MRALMYTSACRMTHLHNQLFSNASHTSMNDVKLGGARPMCGMTLRNLGRSRFKSCTQGYMRPSLYRFETEDTSATAPGIIGLQLLWDALPTPNGTLLQLVGPDVAATPVAETVFDLPSLMLPPTDTSASDARLQKSLKYIEQRIECGALPHSMRILKQEAAALLIAHACAGGARLQCTLRSVLTGS